MQIKKQKSLIQEIRDEYQAEVKKLKRKKFLLKAKLLLTIVLPVFIILLSVKVIKTFVRIKVRDIFSKKPRDSKGTPVPAVMTPVEKEIITPVPVVTETVSES